MENCIKVGDGVTDVEIFKAYHGAEVASHYFGHFLLAHSFKHVQFFHA
jgi:hypothetical protein